MLRRWPATLDAIVLLPDHLHLLLALPTGETNVSTRVASLKAGFTRRHPRRVGFSPPSEGGINPDGGLKPTLQGASRDRQRYRDVWQKRFHDHLIRDDADYERHLDYLAYNPVRHGLCRCPHDWPHSSFARLVRERIYKRDWLCCCDRDPPARPPAVPSHLAGLD